MQNNWEAFVSQRQTFLTFRERDVKFTVCLYAIFSIFVATITIIICNILSWIFKNNDLYTVLIMCAVYYFI